MATDGFQSDELADARDSLRFMFDSPEPLPAMALIEGFTPDSTLAWIIAYAGPCGDPECKKDGVPGGHTRLYLIPMIGWLHATIGDEEMSEIQLRPAIMAAGGSVLDYMHVDPVFKFIAVLRATDDVVEVARGLYKERFGTEEEIIIEKSSSLSN